MDEPVNESASSFRSLIGRLHQSGASTKEIAELIYRNHQLDLGGADHELTNSIRVEVAVDLDVPETNVYVTGSSKLGFSLSHGGQFRVGAADLDLAIVDPKLASMLLAQATEASQDFHQVAAFPVLLAPGSRTTYQTRQRFTDYLRFGIVHPDYMPACATKTRLCQLSASLTQRYGVNFLEVSALVYSSHGAFIDAQRKKIDKYLESQVTGVSVDLPGWSDPADEVVRVSLDALTQSNLLPGVVWEALSSINAIAKVTAAIAVPIESDDSHMRESYDVLVVYERGNSGSDPIPKLWDIASRLGRRNVVIRFVPSELDAGTLLHIVSSHMLTISKELGERGVSRRMIIGSI